MKEHLDIKSESTDGSRIGKYHWFKKKSEQKKHESSDVNLWLWYKKPSAEHYQVYGPGNETRLYGTASGNQEDGIH